MLTWKIIIKTTQDLIGARMTCLISEMYLVFIYI